RLAASIGVSPIVVGLTVVSFGTSAPELVVCTVAALGGNPDLAIGNVMGSNLANIGLILGLTAIVRPLKVHSRVVAREMPLMLVITIVLYALLWDMRLSRADGVILLLAFAAYLVFVFQSVGDEAPEILDEYEGFLKTSARPGLKAYLPDIGWVLAGSACLVLGGYCIVEGAVQVASSLGLSQVAIGLTVVAVGTSLPELATSLVAAARNESDIAVGNVIGSNIFNVSAILGTTAVLAPIPIPRTILFAELPAVLFMSALIFPLLWSGWQLRRFEGVILLAAYVGVGIFLF
ncbi:MAG: calcium/sodium antiporter, partial [Gemmatimonadetes bacterium]|nr:calcium/sodium antiporter [Gemmatimonadota bacterium]